MLRFLVLNIIIGGLIYSCKLESNEVQNPPKEDVELNTISFEGIYSIGILENMKVTSSLSDYADIQYSNIFHGEYLMAEHIAKDKFVRNANLDELKDSQISSLGQFAMLHSEKLNNKIKVIRETEFMDYSINGLKAKVKAIDAERFGAAGTISFWLAYIEGEKLFYSIEIQCPETRKFWFESNANAMIQSFREIKE